MWNLNENGYKNLLVPNVLARFAKNCTQRPCGYETDFVNHMSSGSESVVQRRFSAASAADLTPGAATIGDWHARIADRRRQRRRAVDRVDAEIGEFQRLYDGSRGRRRRPRKALRLRHYSARP